MIHFGYIIFFQVDCNHQLAVELSGDGAVVPSPHVLALGDWHFQVNRVFDGCFATAENRIYRMGLHHKLLYGYIIRYS